VTSTLVPRPRQALDGLQYGGTQPTDISRINRRCYWSRSCPVAPMILNETQTRPPADRTWSGRSARRPSRVLRI
jgi:hypothetical protein